PDVRGRAVRQPDRGGGGRPAGGRARRGDGPAPPGRGAGRRAGGRRAAAPPRGDRPVRQRPRAPGVRGAGADPGGGPMKPTELANLVGYRPGPGVAANVFLAFQLDKGPHLTAVETLIPAGTAAKSVPTDDQQPQTFETSEPLAARAEWNALLPRMTLPQQIDS